jgi:hypothetical protein
MLSILIRALNLDPSLQVFSMLSNLLVVGLRILIHLASKEASEKAE